jgi:hypothetical protein
MRLREFSLLTVLVASTLSMASTCASDSTKCQDNNGNLASVGGPVPGPIDNHCYLNAEGNFPGGPISPQVTDQPSCYADAGLNPDGGPPADEISCGLFPDGGPAGCTPECDQPDGGPAGCDPEYGATMYNSSGNDDDCKYQTAWWSSPIVENGNTTLYFTALHTVDGTPATGANVYAEVFLPSANHLSPSTNPPVQETPPGSGVYTIGPVVFDQPGMWTVRFHLNEECLDILPDSPHGHAAYYVNVP